MLCWILSHFIFNSCAVAIVMQDKDEDAMLLGAQFCTYSFSSISADNIKHGASFSFYARQDCTSE